MCEKEKWHGRCCCNCKSHLEDFHHCTTVSDRKPGTCFCNDHKGWICMGMLGDSKAHSGWSEHGICEMHEKKKL